MLEDILTLWFIISAGMSIASIIMLVFKYDELYSKNIEGFAIVHIFTSPVTWPLFCYEIYKGFIVPKRNKKLEQKELKQFEEHIQTALKLLQYSPDLSPTGAVLKLTSEELTTANQKIAFKLAKELYSKGLSSSEVMFEIGKKLATVSVHELLIEKYQD